MELLGALVILDVNYDGRWQLYINYCHLDKVLAYYEISIFLANNVLILAT